MNMRRKDKEVGEKQSLEAIIRSCRVCHLGLCRDGEPYVVPVCFGYDGTCLYLHCAPHGRKLDILKANNRVCFEMECDCEFVPDEVACRSGFRYRSVIGRGTAAIVSDAAEKQRALSAIMATYSDRRYTFPAPSVEATVVVRIDIESLTGKVGGY